MSFPHGTTVTVRRPGGEDQYGDPLPSTEHTVAGCALAPRTSTELTDLRDTVIRGYTLYGPYGADIQPTDQIVLNDDTVWQVEGDVGRWASPYTGSRPGLEVALSRVTG